MPCGRASGFQKLQVDGVLSAMRFSGEYIGALIRDKNSKANHLLD
jgi:hypothetical protein